VRSRRGGVRRSNAAAMAVIARCAAAVVGDAAPAVVAVPPSWLDAPPPSVVDAPPSQLDAAPPFLLPAPLPVDPAEAELIHSALIQLPEIMFVSLTSWTNSEAYYAASGMGHTEQI
jgi:hypothetical protein